LPDLLKCATVPPRNILLMGRGAEKLGSGPVPACCDVVGAVGVSTSLDIDEQFFTLDAALMCFVLAERAGFVVSPEEIKETRSLIFQAIGSKKWKVTAVSSDVRMGPDKLKGIIRERVATILLHFESLRDTFLAPNHDVKGVKFETADCIEKRPDFKVIHSIAAKELKYPTREFLEEKLPAHMLKRIVAAKLERSDVVLSGNDEQVYTLLLEYFVWEVSILIFNACKQEGLYDRPRAFVSHSGEQDFANEAAKLVEKILFDLTENALKKVLSTNAEMLRFARQLVTQKEKDNFMCGADADTDAEDEFAIKRLIIKLATCAFEVTPPTAGDYIMTDGDYKGMNANELFRAVLQEVAEKIPKDKLRIFKQMHIFFDNIGMGRGIKTKEKPHYDITSSESGDIEGNNLYLGRDSYVEAFDKFWFLVQGPEVATKIMVKVLIQREIDGLSKMSIDEEHEYGIKRRANPGKNRFLIYKVAKELFDRGVKKLELDGNNLDRILKGQYSTQLESMARAKLKSYKTSGKLYLEKIVRPILEHRFQITGELEGDIDLDRGGYTFPSYIEKDPKSSPRLINPRLNPRGRGVALMRELDRAYLQLRSHVDVDVAEGARLIIRMLAGNILIPYKEVYEKKKSKLHDSQKEDQS
jgi:hypothetical protein